MDDAVKTAQGKVGITFADDTKVQVNENSRLVIDDFVYDHSRSAGDSVHRSTETVGGGVARTLPATVSLSAAAAPPRAVAPLAAGGGGGGGRRRWRRRTGRGSDA